MKKLILLILLYIPCLVSFGQININLSGYPLVTSGWSIGSNPAGVCTAVDSTLRLTNATTGTASYAYYNTGVNMAGWCEWTADFDFKISGTGTLADGMSFWFLSNPPLSAATGAAIGLPTNPNGVMLVFDTYDNNSTPAENPQISLLGYNGSVAGYVEGSATGRLCAPLNGQAWVYNAQWHHVKVTYHLGTIKVYFDYVTTPSMVSTTTYPLSITGYFGFSGSTGALTSTQLVKNVAIVVNDCLTPINNGPLCQADTLRLDAFGDSTGATYLWYGPNSFSSTLQNPIRSNVSYLDSGDYYVVKTYGGIPDTEFTHVSIKLNPIVTAGSNSPVCLGSPINLTSGVASTGETFSWTGPGTYTSAVQNPTITSAALTDTGFYTVIATLNGCKDTATTHVNVIRVAIPTDSSNSPLCNTETLQLYANDSVSGVTWSWSGPAGFTSVLQNPTIPSVTTANAGIYTVTASVGACTASDTILVVINNTPNLPSIIVRTAICSGQTITLTLDPASLTPGATYYWTGPNGYTSTNANNTIPNATMATSGIYSVYAASGNCATTVTHQYFEVDTTPEVPLAYNNGPLCTNNVLQLNSSDNTAGVIYSWAGPASYTSTQQNPSIYPLLTSMSGNYTVTATLHLCSSSAVTNVLINQKPYNPIVGSNGPICGGQLLLLNASFTPYTGTFHWTGPNGFVSNTQNPSILNVTNAAAGTYFVSEVSNGCLSDTVHFDVVILSTPAVPLLSNSSPLCEGNTLYFHATDDTAGVTYTWTGPNGFTSTDQNPVIAPTLPVNAGVYTVVATLGTCSAISSTNVVVTTTPTLTVTSNSPVCTIDTLKLNAQAAPGVTYTWSGPYVSPISPLNGPAPTRYPVTTEYAGVYQVTISDAGGCHNTASTTVIIRQTPPAPWVTWLNFCQYDYAPPLQAVDAANVLWFPSSAGGAGLGVTTPPTPPTNVPGVYFYFLNQTVNGCVSAIDSIQVIVHPKPNILVTPIDTSICPRDSIVYHAAVDDPFATVTWLPTANLNVTTGLSTVAHPVADVTYMAIASNMFNCTDTAFSVVNVYPAALISVQVTDSVTIYTGESYQIQPLTNCSSFAWFPPQDLSNPYIADPTATPQISTVYIVTGVTENGCIARDSVYFHVNDDNTYGMPNAFAPGTGGNNQFKMIVDGIAKLNYFRVYNRWGELVFETKNITEGWDGTYKGDPQPFGVYVYDIQAVSALTGKLKTMRGNVTLLR